MESSDNSGGEGEEGEDAVDQLTSYSCPDCDAKFKRKDGLVRHRRTQHDDYQNGQQKHRCPFEDCGVEIGRRDHLRRHIVQVHKADPAEVLPQPDLRRRHLGNRRGSDDKNGAVEDGKRFKCVFEGCNTELSRMDHLRRHVRRVHKQDPAQVPGLEGKKRASGGVRNSLHSKRKREVPGGKQEGASESKITNDIMDYLDSGSPQEEEDDDQLKGEQKIENREEMEETIVKEENQDQELCILCCSFYYPFAKIGGSDIFNEFVTQVARNRGGSSSSSSSSKFNNGEVERLPVCPDCRELAGSVTEKRLEVDLLEAEVRQLQVKILKEMRKLERSIANYYTEWRKLGAVVNESDVASLEGLLRRNAREGKAEDNSLVLLLRDGIVSGGNRNLLKTYHRDLETKLCYSQDDLNEYGSGSKEKSAARPQRCRRKVKKVTQSPEPSKHPKAPNMGQNENSDHYSDPSPGEASNEISGDDETPHLQNDQGEDEDDGASEEADEDSDFNINPDEISESEEGDSESGSASENEEDEADKNSNRNKSESGKAEVSKFAFGNKPYGKKVRKRKKETRLKCGIDTSMWSPFKRKLLRKCAKDSRKRQKKETETESTSESGATIPDPSLKYCLEYNPKSDQFHVGSISVRLPTGDEEYLECSKCALRILQTSLPNMLKVSNEIQKHIQREHLSVFQCPLCPSNLGSFRRYRDHLHRHQGRNYCSTCNKSFVSPETLRAHHWNRHMTPEEIAEALEAGDKDPRRKRDPDKPPPVNCHQCPTCGKSFPCPAVLKTHEAIHREDRERLLCPTCGGTFTGKASLDYHQKYACFPPGQEPPRVTCDQCPATFKSKPLLKRHLKYAHSSAAVEKPFKCELCGKGFADNMFLGKHLRTHSDDRPYLCRNGCGATYKTGKHRSRHEKLCGGVSTGRSVARGRKVEKIEAEDGGDLHMDLYRGHFSGAFS